MSDELYTEGTTYPLVAIFWEDHLSRKNSPIPKDPDDEIIPTLTVGILMRETDKSLVVLSTFERYEDRDDGDYIIILKSTVIGKQQYGEINLDHVRFD